MYHNEAQSLLKVIEYKDMQFDRFDMIHEKIQAQVERDARRGGSEAMSV